MGFLKLLLEYIINCVQTNVSSAASKCINGFVLQGRECRAKASFQILHAGNLSMSFLHEENIFSCM